jgi:hypothetical protein
MRGSTIIVVTDRVRLTVLQQSCDDVFGVPTEINLLGINLPKERMKPPGPRPRHFDVFAISGSWLDLIQVQLRHFGFKESLDLRPAASAQHFRHRLPFSIGEENQALQEMIGAIVRGPIFLAELLEAVSQCESFAAGPVEVNEVTAAAALRDSSDLRQSNIKWVRHGTPVPVQEWMEGGTWVVQEAHLHPVQSAVKSALLSSPQKSIFHFPFAI